jgi:hypothetical protein
LRKKKKEGEKRGYIYICLPSPKGLSSVVPFEFAALNEDANLKEEEEEEAAGGGGRGGGRRPPASELRSPKLSEVFMRARLEMLSRLKELLMTCIKLRCT